jgi:hypothetical protein
VSCAVRCPKPGPERGSSRLSTAWRTGPHSHHFVDGVVVALERGTTLADVLRAQAADVREARKRNLLEIGGRKEITADEFTQRVVGRQVQQDDAHVTLLVGNPDRAP